MRTLFIAALVAAAFSAAAADTKPIVIDSADGQSTWTAMRETARTYTNRHGVEQVDMLWQARYGKRSLGRDQRIRYGVTGCVGGQGVVAEVEFDGEPKLVPEPFQWTRGGEQVLDGIAVVTCGVAFQRKLEKEQQQ